MNSNTSTTKAKTPDLLILPQAGAIIPGQHLTPEQAEQAKKDWNDYGNTPTESNTRTVWNIAVAHILNGQPTITSTLTIPTRTEQPAPHLATRAGNAA